MKGFKAVMLAVATVALPVMANGGVAHGHQG
jgi:hypothetical protein